MNQLFTVLIVSLFALSTPEDPKSQEEHCAVLLSEIQDKISKARSCSSDAECTVAGLDCPFGCGTPLNTIFVPQIKEAVRAYQGQCPSCKYRCSTRKRSLKCHDGECKLLPENPTFSTPRQQSPGTPPATEL